MSKLFICITCTHFLQHQFMEIDHEQSPLCDDSSFIPADYNYLNINLMTQDYIADFPIGSYIVPFMNNSVQFSIILQDLYKILSINQNKYPIDRISLCLSEGSPVKKVSTVQDLRIKLFRQSASGITLRAKLTNGMVQEAAANFFYHNQAEYNGQLRVDRLFVLINNEEPFYICMENNIKARKLHQVIVKNLNDFYKNDIVDGHVKFYMTKREQNEQSNTIEWSKKQEIKGLQIQNYLRLPQRNVIGIEVIKQNVLWPRSEVNNQQFLIIYLDKESNFKLKFSQIQKYTVKQLLQSIQIQGAENFGLKIINQIFRPRQLINEIAKYFKEGQGKYIKNIQCTLIDQREMFYREMDSLKEDYVIQKALVTASKEYQFQKCRQLARNRIEQKQIREKFVFTSAQEISPIAFYTSSVEVIDGNSSVLLYKGLNENLRQNHFGMVKIDYSKDWKYKFTATLNRSLKKLNPYGNKQLLSVFYRGVKGHIIQCEVGQIYVEKQYASTTLDQEKARAWIRDSPAASLIKIQAKSGRLIEDFSLYKSQKQVLFMPYTYFEVTHKKLVTQDKRTRVELTFRQIDIPSYRSNPASYILWIDDKLKEGEKVISSLDCPMHTTFLHQLKSNKQLREWISNNQNIISNDKIKIGIITNMRRIQDGIEDKFAGAQTMKIANEKMPLSQKVCYVNNIDGAKNALKQKGLNPEIFKVINKRVQLRQFIAKVTEPQTQWQEDISKSAVTQRKRQQLKKIYDINQTS